MRTRKRSTAVIAWLVIARGQGGLAEVRGAYEAAWTTANAARTATILAAFASLATALLFAGVPERADIDLHDGEGP